VLKKYNLSSDAVLVYTLPDSMYPELFVFWLVDLEFKHFRVSRIGGNEVNTP